MWRDLEPDLATLTVRRQRVVEDPTSRVREKPPKSHNGNRSLRLDPVTLQALTDTRPKTEAAIVSGYMFTGRGGRPLRPDTVTSRFNRLAVAAGSTRSARIRFGTCSPAALLDTGHGIAEVAERLGHDPATLMRYYSRVNAVRRRQAADHIEDLIASGVTVTRRCGVRPAAAAVRVSTTVQRIAVLVRMRPVHPGFVGNVAAGQQRWPGVLDLVRMHPWPAVGVLVLVLVGVAVEVGLWLWPRNESTQAPSSGTGTRATAWNVPPRTAAFTGRDQLLADLHQRLCAGGPVVVQALHGWGGVGKTTLAIEYAHRFAEDYWLVWWVDAERAELIGEHLAALGAEAGWVARDAPTSEAIATVRRQLHASDGWLMVFDNAISPAEIREWLPQGPGHVLVTSRYAHWEQIAAAVSVNMFTRNESVTLLKRLCPSLSVALADQISEALGDLPLGITQAGGVLAETGISGHAYLDELRQHAPWGGRTKPKPLKQSSANGDDP